MTGEPQLHVVASSVCSGCLASEIFTIFTIYSFWDHSDFEVETFILNQNWTVFELCSFLYWSLFTVQRFYLSLFNFKCEYSNRCFQQGAGLSWGPSIVPCVPAAGWVTTGGCTRCRLLPESGVRRTGPPRGMGPTRVKHQAAASHPRCLLQYFCCLLSANNKFPFFTPGYYLPQCIVKFWQNICNSART